MTEVQIEILRKALAEKRKGTLREAFPGEEPDLVVSKDYILNSITIIRNGSGFTAEFPVPILLVAGSKYVFEESVE